MPPKKTSRKGALITGNWKMYKTMDEATQFLNEFAPKINVPVYLAVPFTAIASCVAVVKECGAPIAIGAQNMNDASEGAFTGEIAGTMLKESGAHFVILGHSERRTLFKESNQFINRKIKRALADGLQPILCIGETGEERKRGETEKVLEEQLLQSLEGVLATDLKKMILAYEPVWAIGTGVHATAQEAEKCHAFCRELIEKYWTKTVATALTIQYGGSVTPENCKELVDQKNIDGLLVGGASLSAEKFGKIVNSVTQTGI